MHCDEATRRSGPQCVAFDFAFVTDARSTQDRDVSMPFAEIIGDQSRDRVDCLRFVRAIGFKHDAASFAGREHHDAHDAFCIDLATIARECDLALVFRSQLGELCRGGEMEPRGQLGAEDQWPGEGL